MAIANQNSPAVINRADQNAPAKREGGLVNIMAAGAQLDRATFINTIKAMCFRDGKATNEQLAALLVVANRYGLDPLTKEIYAFPTKGGGIQPLVGIDGWIKLANSHPQMDGLEIVENFDELGKISSATATIWRKDRKMPVTLTEHVAECKRNTEPWNNQPIRMIRHRAVIQGIRYAFGYAGISDTNDSIEFQGMPAAALPEQPPVAGLIEPNEMVSDARPSMPQSKGEAKQEPEHVCDTHEKDQDINPLLAEGFKRGYTAEQMEAKSQELHHRAFTVLTTSACDKVFAALEKEKA